MNTKDEVNKHLKFLFEKIDIEDIEDLKYLFEKHPNLDFTELKRKW